MPTPASLPITMSFVGMDVELVADAQQGVLLSEITNTSTGLTWSVAEVSDTDELAQGGVWSMEARWLTIPFSANVLNPSNQPGFLVTPDMARSFEILDVSTDLGVEEAYLARWNRVSLPRSLDSDEINVEVLFIRSTAGSTKLEMELRMSRGRGGSMTIDAIRMPVVSLACPNAPRATEGVAEVAARCRVLVANNLSAIGPLGIGSAVPVAAWQALGTSKLYEHPNPGMPLPFWSACAVDAADAASYLNFLHVQAEDPALHQKRFRFRASLGGSGTKQLFYGAHEYLPAYVRAFCSRNDSDGHRPEAWTRNEHTAPYRVSITVGEASSQAWWFDCAKLYRDYAHTAYAALLTPRKTSSLASLSKGRDFFAPVNCFERYFIQVSEARADRKLAFVEAIGAGMAGTAEKAKLWFEDQGPLVQGQSQTPFPNGPIDGPGEPEPNYSDGFRELPPRLKAVESIDVEGVMVYVRAGDLSHEGPRGEASRQARQLSYRSFLPGANVVIDPTEVVESALDRVFLDVSAPGSMVAEHARADAAMRGGVDAVYYDTLGGGYTNYPRREAGPRSSEAGGGSYSSEWVRRLVTEVRARGLLKWTGNENFVEQLLSLIEWTQTDYGTQNLWTALMEPAADILGIFRPLSEANHPDQCRELAPPLVQMVWGRYLHMSRLLLPFSKNPLASSPAHPGPGGEPGLTDQELIDVQCMLRAAALTSGASPFTIENYVGSADELLEPDDGGAGEACWAFLRHLHDWCDESKLGAFLMGLMERPLDYAPGGGLVSRQTNPALAMLLKCNTTGALPDAIGPAIRYSFFNLPSLWPTGSLMYAPMEVPQVLVTSWLDPESGDYGFIAANWSNSDAAAWRGTLDPALYSPGALTVETADGGSTSLGALAASSTLGFNDAGATFNVVLPKRTVKLVRLTPP